MVQRYNRRPSEFLGIEDPYTAYCFDEACTFIQKQLDDGKEFVQNRHYTSFTELYKNYT